MKECLLFNWWIKFFNLTGKQVYLKYIIVVLCLLPVLLFGQTGELRGRITDDHSAIPGVSVLLTGTSFGAVSDEDGRFRVVSITPGTYEVRFSAVGYETLTKTVTIRAGKPAVLNLVMKSLIIETEEVQVLGSRQQQQSDPGVSVIDLKPKSAGILPGAVQDVLRTLQSLPGVLAPNDFTSQMIIRGSGPDQNLIIMDDVEVFNPYRLYGVISMFNPEAVSDIKLITGGFPAQYGDRLSAVLDVTNREGPLNANIRGNLNASIVSANLVLEGKNPFNIRGSWLFNSRRTYYDLIIEPFVKKAKLVEDNVSFPNFYDLQGKIAFGPFNGHRFILNGIYSRDGVEIVSGEKRITPDSVSVKDLTRNDLASFAWHYSPSKKILNKVVASWYRNSGDASFGASILDPTLNRDNYEKVALDTLGQYLLGFGFNSDFTFAKYSIEDRFTYFWGNNEFSAGGGVDFMTTTLSFLFDLSHELKAILAGNPNFRAVLNDVADVKHYNRYKAFVQNNFKLGEKLYIQPGLRLDYYNILEKYYLSPRISLSYALNDITTLRTVWGQYYQSPGYEKLRDANILFDLNRQYTADLQAERATHYVVSLERWINEEWRGRIETYYKRFNNLIIQKEVPGTAFYIEQVPGQDPHYKDAWTRPVAFTADSTTQIPVNGSHGEAYGFEVLVEKRNVAGSRKLSGWLSYALAYANRFEEGKVIPFRFDQRHTVNIVLEYQVNNWLNAGFRWQFGSGFPFTEPVGIKPRIIMTDKNLDGIPETAEVATRSSYANRNAKPAVIYDIDYGGRNDHFNTRKPDYHRLDIRMTASARFWSLDWNFYLDVINVYNRSNVINYDYFVTNDLKLERKATKMFPILPTLGFSLRF